MTEQEFEVVKCLSVKQPYADLMTYGVYRDKYGRYFAEKQIEVRSRDTSYRGDLLICASKKPVIEGRMSGCTCGFVELYDVKKCSEFTAEDWELTCVPERERKQYENCYGWMMRNPRRVVEMPIAGRLGFYNVSFPKGDLTEYPRELYFGKDGFKLLKEKNKL